MPREGNSFSSFHQVKRGSNPESFGAERRANYGFDLNMNEVGFMRRKATRGKERIFVEQCDSPFDANGKLLSVPFKLEIELREDELSDQRALMYRMIEVMNYYSGHFEIAASHSGIMIAAKEEMQFMSDGRRCVLPFQLECWHWQSTLTQFLNLFFLAVGKDDIPTHEMPLISTYSLLLYPLRLLNVHDNIPLARIQFGSLMNNGTLGVHWLMSGGTHTLVDLENGLTSPKGIYAYFEYDRRTISVDYCNRETDPDERYLEIDVRGKITIDMSSIHRIIFNQKIYGDSFHRRVSIVLLLDTPPKLQIMRKNDKHLHPADTSPSTSWEYRAELQKGRFPGEISDKVTLHDSKAVVLEFDTCGISERLHQSSFPDSFFYDIVSRLRQKTGKMIEFLSLNEINLIKGDVKSCRWDEVNVMFKVPLRPFPVCPYDVKPFFDETVLRYINNAASRLVQKQGLRGEAATGYHIRWKAFRLHALLQGILDRGMEYRIELLRSRYRWYMFVDMTADRYANDENRTLHALERVMCLISEGRQSRTIPILFEKEWADSTFSRRSALFNEHEKKEGYWRIMKLVATPTRVIFVGYEVIMGNRVLNKYAKNENHIIRLAFRDDRGGFLRITDYVPEVQARIKRFLVRGITYAGRTFAWLGNSNSQLREQGCYMIHVDRDDRSADQLLPQDIHRQMGDFHRLPNIPKMLARLGQVFTQSRPSEIPLSPCDFGVTFDLTGGRNAADKPFVFSDGVGLVSASHANSLSCEHGIDVTASAFQIRFRGEKGLLCVDPSIDERNELLKMMGREEEQKKVLVRPSMSKFFVMEEARTNLEIVKFSSSSVIFLNRPFINILCQVSQSQSAQCHRRVKGRVMELMRTMLSECLQSLYIEHKAVQAIREMSFPFSMDLFTPSSGLSLTTDPFFRALLRANTNYVIQKQLTKMNIRIPTSTGRLMFGVVDITGILQYGQVFCQYSGRMGKHAGKTRSIGSQKGLIHKGLVLITKNPCISSGDVRMFEAVDIPALRHLVDVVVFPMHGPRPHPDEMAGSDLDGDEYMVIWDEALFLERSEEASVFPIGEEKEKWIIPKKEDGSVDFRICEERKAEFFTEAIVVGQPGMLCNAHLAISDLYGLDSKPSKSLAHKIAQTLDYQKSGIKPEEITKETIQDPDDPNRVIPAEKSNLKPDFLRNFREPGYESRGILGEVFREACKYENALERGEEKMEKIERDPSFLVEGWEYYKTIAEIELMAYDHAMKSVIEHYGISTEEEMLSGMILSVKNRLSENEEHDGTLFTTNRVIEGKVRRIIETTRERFFQTLLDWRVDLDEVQNKRNDVMTESIMNRRVRGYTRNIEDIRKKAAAAYNVAYEAANTCIKRGEPCTILLSFPWVVYDVLADIKLRPDSRIVRVIPDETREQFREPLADRLSACIDRYSEEPSNVQRFAAFMMQFDRDDSILSRSMRENPGLARASFVLREWANHVGGLNDRFREEHLVSLFVLFGLGQVGTRGLRRRFLQKPMGDIRQHPTKGVHLLHFIDYVSSNEFRMSSSLSFSEIGCGILMRGEWRSFSEIALSSFLSLVISHRLDLPMEYGNVVTAATLREYEPRVMQLPAGMTASNLDEVREALCKVSGCQVKLRHLRSQMVIVSAVGRSEQLRVLSSFIYPPAPPRESSTLKGKIESLAAFTIERLMKAANIDPSF